MRRPSAGTVSRQGKKKEGDYITACAALHHEGQHEAPLGSLMKAAGCKEPVECSPAPGRSEAAVPGTASAVFSGSRWGGGGRNTSSAPPAPSVDRWDSAAHPAPPEGSLSYPEARDTERAWSMEK